MDQIKNLTAGQLKENAPEIKIGSTVKVHVKIREGERERIQVFEGTVIARNNSGIAETFTVRRAKLYYLRDRVGKAAKVKEQIK